MDTPLTMNKATKKPDSNRKVFKLEHILAACVIFSTIAEVLSAILQIAQFLHLI